MSHLTTLHHIFYASQCFHHEIAMNQFVRNIVCERGIFDYLGCDPGNF